MPKRVQVYRHGGMLIGADAESKDYIRTMQHGNNYFADILQDRSGPFHRKVFAFVNLAFQYWEPKNFVHQTELSTVNRLARFMVTSGVGKDAVETLCKEFLKQLNQSRSRNELTKDIDAFREFVTIKAGFYETVIGPSGPEKRAISWAYKNLGQDRFEKLFTAVREVCWELILSQKFESIEEAERVANQLMGFD